MVSISNDIVLFAIVKNALKRCFSRSPQYRTARAKCRRETMIGKRKRVFFTCAHCGKEFMRSETHVDHVSPIIPPGRPIISYDELVARIFTDNLQVLCKPCHAKKSAAENAERRAPRANSRKKQKSQK